MLTRKCDYCNRQATVDAKTIYGPWAYMCDEHNEMYGVKAFQIKLANLTEGGSPITTSEPKEDSIWK